MEFHLKGSVCLVGDIHGEYVPRNDVKANNEKLADNYIFLGDIGFGFFGLTSFVKELNRVIPEGVEVYFIRGNHDDPSFWKGWKKPKIQETCPRFHMVGDYDVLVINGKKYLCIGGGISIDRFYRIEGESYWSDEKILPCPSQNAFGEICGVLSHTGFTPPVITHKNAFMEKFPDVKQDCQDEQRVLFDILNLYHPKVWYNGHYHVHVDFMVKACEVHALDINEHVII